MQRRTVLSLLGRKLLGPAGAVLRLQVVSSVALQSVHYVAVGCETVVGRAPTLREWT